MGTAALGDAEYVVGRVRLVLNVELALTVPVKDPAMVKFPELSREQIDVPEALSIRKGVIAAALFATCKQAAGDVVCIPTTGSFGVFAVPE